MEDHAQSSDNLLSLAMIVRNESANLANCLSSLVKVVDEIVIVDTGSTDGTHAIAQSFGAKVYEIEWPHDFSQARNHSLAHCSGNWVLYLDADEWLAAEDVNKLVKLKQSGLQETNKAWLLRQLSGPMSDGGWLAIDQVRLFPKLPGVAWEGLVHEQIGDSLVRRGIRFEPSGITIRHSGYSDPSGLDARRQRNAPLLKRQVELTPQDPMAHFHWGQELLRNGQPVDGIRELETAYQQTNRNLLVFRHIAVRLMEAYANRGQNQEATRVYEDWPKERCRPHAMLMKAADIYKQSGDVYTAEACLREAVNTPIPKSASYEDPLIVERARYQLGWLCFETARPLEARQHFSAVANHPLASALGWKGLGIAAMLTSRWDEALQAVEMLDGISHSRLDGILLRAQVYMRRGDDLSRVRVMLEQAVVDHPNSVNAWLFLAQCYLRDKSTWPQAVPALHRVLELQPNHQEARHNLAILRKQRISPAVEPA